MTPVMNGLSVVTVARLPALAKLRQWPSFSAYSCSAGMPPVYVSSDSYPRRAGRMLASVRKAWIENETATSPRNCSTPR